MDGFNFYHSSHRVHIEEAFGHLVKKWKILKKHMKYNLAICTKIIKVAALLHNFTKDYDGKAEPEIPKWKRDQAEEDLKRWIRWRHFNLDDEEWWGTTVEDEGNVAVRRAVEASETRRRLTLHLQRRGIARSIWAGVHDVFIESDLSSNESE